MKAMVHRQGQGAALPGGRREGWSETGGQGHHRSGEWQILRHRWSGRLGSSRLRPSSPSHTLCLRCLWNAGTEGMARTQRGVRGGSAALPCLRLASRPPALPLLTPLLTVTCLSRKTSLTICGEGSGFGFCLLRFLFCGEAMRGSTVPGRDSAERTQSGLNNTQSA